MSDTEHSRPSEPIARTDGGHRFTVLSESDVYVGKIFAVRSDEVAMPGGGRSRRDVVEHSGAVAVLALDEHGHVVLIHQYRYPLGRRLWELPAGLLDVEGEDPLHTARRELAEETGLVAESWSVLVDVAASPGFTDHSERVYLARGLSEVNRPDPVADEEADLVVERVELARAVDMAMAGEIVNATAVSGLLAAEAVLAGRVRSRDAHTPWPDRPRAFVARRGQDPRR